MRTVALILLLFPGLIYSQQKRDNFYEIDTRARSIPFANTDTLAKQLAALGKTDREKVRAIFRWITEHIDYNVMPVGSGRKLSRQFYKEPEDTGLILPSLNERVAAKVLKNGVAFCEGYSQLFKSLCGHAGIKAELVYGYARTNNNRRFAVNHTWNSVYIDSAWYLLDVTWASGVVTYGNQYMRSYNDFYFLTSPDEFIRDHYPEDPQWTLLKDPPIYREYAQSPFRYSGYIKAGLSGYFPSKGVIDVAVGDTILIELRSYKEIRNFFVSGSPVLDTTQLTEISSANPGDKKIVLRYSITTATGEWLYVFCNEELALRYKLNVKKEIVKAND